MKPEVRRALVQGIGGGIGGALGTVIVLRFVEIPKASLGAVHGVALVIGLPFAYYLGVALHELGHVIAGLMAGFRPWLFAVGPVKAQRHGTQWRIARNRTFPLLGGFAGCMPVGLHSLRQRMSVLLAGGAAANILTVIAVIAILASADLPRVDGRIFGWYAVFYLWSAAVAVFSGLMALSALMPGSGHGYSTDGARLLRFMKRDRQADAEVALLALIAASTCGQRPREWDASLVHRALELPPDTPHGLAAMMMAQAHAEDLGQLDEARRLLEATIAGRAALPLMSQPTVAYMAAQFAALHDRDAVRARAHLESTRTTDPIDTYKKPLVEALVRWREGSRDVSALLDAAEQEMPNSIDPGGAARDREILAWLRGQQ